jgi:seryl-tRNA synthetase
LLRQKDELLQKKKAQEDVVATKLDILRTKAKTVGNYVHDSVPVSNNEDNNETIRTWAPEGFDENSQEHASLSHHEVLSRLDGYDSERGVKLVGHRGYCLTGYGYFLFVYLLILDLSRS